MRVRKMLAAGLVTVVMGTNAQASEPVFDDNESYDTPAYSSGSSSGFDLNGDADHSKEDMIRWFCRYIEEEGLDETVEIAEQYLKQGAKEKAIEKSTAGFTTGTLKMEFPEKEKTKDDVNIPHQTLCEYDVRLTSALCGFEYSRTVKNNAFWLHDDDGSHRVTLVSQTDFFQDTHPFSPEKESIAAYEYLAQLPRSPDRLYLAAVVERLEGLVVSVLELPAIEKCYEVIPWKVNDDGFIDLVAYDLSALVDNNGVYEWPSRKYCANKDGYFSSRTCTPKPQLPPHLRIKHKEY